jgi:hypothetical protein
VSENTFDGSEHCDRPSHWLSIVPEREFHCDPDSVRSLRAEAKTQSQDAAQFPAQRRHTFPGRTNMESVVPVKRILIWPILVAALVIGNLMVVHGVRDSFSPCAVIKERGVSQPCWHGAGLLKVDQQFAEENNSATDGHGCTRIRFMSIRIQNGLPVDNPPLHLGSLKVEPPLRSENNEPRMHTDRTKGQSNVHPCPKTLSVNDPLQLCLSLDGFSGGAWLSRRAPDVETRGPRGWQMPATALSVRIAGGGLL